MSAGLGGSYRPNNKVCRYCNRPLTKIDRYGEVLIGCIDCNRWGHPGDKKLTLEMLEEDLAALRALERQKHPQH